MCGSNKEMISYYRSRAAEYDRIYDKPERQADLAAIRNWLPGRFDGETVLEVACGTGYWTQFIARSAARVVAIDAAPEVLSIARSRVSDAAVNFEVGDAYHLPTAHGLFDAAFAGFWFSHVPRARWREFLQGIGGRLRSGGRVVLLDNLYVEGSSTPICDTDADGNIFQLRRLDDGSEHRVLKNFPTEDALHGVVSQVGILPRYFRWQHYWALEYQVG